MICDQISECLCSKPVRTLFWLLLATAFCVMIAVYLASLHVTKTDDFKTGIVDIAPKPNNNQVIYYKYKDLDSVKKLTRKIQNFLAPYKKAQANRNENQIDCTFNSYPKVDETCFVDIRNFTPCIEGLHYGYAKATPCIFLKFKKRLDWIPKYLGVNNFTNAGLSLPFLKEIKESYEQQKPHFLKSIWVNCVGESPYDAQLLGTVNYLPWKGFPGFYFPYHGQNDYIEPLVVIHLANIRVGISININCTIAAHNFYETINFRVFVDDLTF